MTVVQVPNPVLPPVCTQPRFGAVEVETDLGHAAVAPCVVVGVVVGGNTGGGGVRAGLGLICLGD